MISGLFAETTPKRPASVSPSRVKAALCAAVVLVTMISWLISMSFRSCSRRAIECLHAVRGGWTLR